MIIAIVNEWVVTAIQTIVDPSEDGGAAYQAYAANCQIAIDITNFYPQPVVGWTFNGSQLVPPPNYTPSMQITKLSFRERFTMTELIGILEASTTNLTIQVMMQNQQVADYIDLNRSDTQSGIEYLVSQGLLTQDRATQILTTLPTTTELYQG